ncbi:MAG: HDOD domain-containing protein [Acidobacteriota bacterium]|nr:HDOD domain-containing protein [Acidobacteriota bacterium]MDQ7087207.1 HDOD domain-containing protein [Acidobacteriota bacterium]
MAIPDSILDGIERLDPLPVSVQRLIEALDDENLHLADVADIIEEDAALTANVLRLVNSSLYAGRFEITRLRDAVTRLGTAELLHLTLGSYITTLTLPAPLYGPE